MANELKPLFTILNPRSRNGMVRLDTDPKAHYDNFSEVGYVIPEYAKVLAAGPDMLAALEATEAAEDHWANCEDCENRGAECPENGCEMAFYLADKARLMRRAAIQKAKGEQ